MLHVPKPDFQYYSGYDSEDDDLMSKAFRINGELSPEVGPPTSGEEYLKRVR